MAFAVSTRWRSWNSLTQLVTVLTISLAVLRAAFTLAGFLWARSERFTIFTTFFSDIFGLSIAASHIGLLSFFLRLISVRPRFTS